MLPVVVLISGGGSNLRALLDALEREGSPARVVAVGADRAAEGLAHAEHYGIETFVVPFAEHPDRATWGDALLAEVQRHEPGLVVLSGFMRLLPPRVVDALAPRMINTHPAFLPEFPGAHGIRDALAAGVAQTGASVIVVDTGVDTGPILAQERVPVEPGDTADTLHDRVKLVERRLLADVVRGVADGSIDLAALPSSSATSPSGAAS